MYVILRRTGRNQQRMRIESQLSWIYSAKSWEECKISHCPFLFNTRPIHYWSFLSQVQLVSPYLFCVLRTWLSTIRLESPKLWLDRNVCCTWGTTNCCQPSEKFSFFGSGYLGKIVSFAPLLGMPFSSMSSFTARNGYHVLAETCQDIWKEFFKVALRPEVAQIRSWYSEPDRNSF